MHVDGALAGTTATFTPGHSLEFSATFGADAFQHVALTDNFNNAWAMFSTRSSTSQLYASTNASDTGGIQDTPIGAPDQYVGSQHLYRIQWDASQVQLLHRRHPGPRPRPPPSTQNLNVATSDFNVGGPELSVDWLQVSPYPASGTFDSRVFDAGPGQSVELGRAQLELGDAVGHRDRDQRPHRRHPDARRDLERLHPDRDLGRRHPRATPATCSTGRRSARPTRT